MEQILRPLSWIPKLLYAIDGMLESSQEQLETFRESRTRPHVLDDDTVTRSIKLYKAQNADTQLFLNQCNHWRKQSSTPSQLADIEKIESRTRALLTCNEEILGILDEIKDKTIDKILARDDAQLGLEFLRGDHPLGN